MEKIIAYTDGGTHGNPGPAAAGVYITNSTGEKIEETKLALGNANNDFAKYYGVLLALQTLEQIYGKKTTEMEYEIKLDSELVKTQLSSERQIKEPGLVPMFIEIHNMRVANFPHLFFTLISSEENKEAGRVVAEALAV